MKKLLSSLFLLALATVQASAQCAMCRSTLEVNFSAGNPGIASGINFGILYLLVLPYLAAVVIGFFWYRSSKNARTQFGKRTA